jgi:hypothetical protein
LRGHGFEQLISGLSRYHSACAPNDGSFTYACNGYIQHDFLPASVLIRHCSVYTRARATPFLCVVRDESLLSGRHWNC